MSPARRANYQTIAWFRDLHKRELLDLDPPYQRRSVWNQRYKDYFIETVLLGYPAPAIFLHEEMTDEGVGRYSVVDGKQRLSTLFEFADNEFAVRDDSVIERLRGKYFTELDTDTRRAFHSYDFSVEYLLSTDEASLNDIFDRINRNVAKLSPQELRHARYSGDFSTGVEELSAVLTSTLPPSFPRIADSSRRQMKDVEFAALLVLLLENGPESTSQESLDRIYADRDEDWEKRGPLQAEFGQIAKYVAELADADDGVLTTQPMRLRNQGDFYALFGAVAQLTRLEQLPPPTEAVARLVSFMTVVGDDKLRVENEDAKSYYEAARSAANDPSQRSTRIRILSGVMRGAVDGGA